MKKVLLVDLHVEKVDVLDQLLDIEVLEIP